MKRLRTQLAPSSSTAVVDNDHDMGESPMSHQKRSRLAYNNNNNNNHQDAMNDISSADTVFNRHWNVIMSLLPQQQESSSSSMDSPPTMNTILNVCTRAYTHTHTHTHLSMDTERLISYV